MKLRSLKHVAIVGVLLVLGLSLPGECLRAESGTAPDAASTSNHESITGASPLAQTSPSTGNVEPAQVGGGGGSTAKESDGPRTSQWVKLIVRPLIAVLCIMFYLYLTRKPERDRSASLRKWAAKHDLTWLGELNDEALPELKSLDIFSDLDWTPRNFISGELNGMAITFFDSKTKKLGKKEFELTSILVVDLPAPISQEVHVLPKTTGMKRLLSDLSGEKIDTESNEFNKAYAIVSKDRKLALGLVHQGFMSLMLNHQHHSVSWAGHSCVLRWRMPEPPHKIGGLAKSLSFFARAKDTRVAPYMLDQCIKEALEVVATLPEYMISGSEPR